MCAPHVRVWNPRKFIVLNIVTGEGYSRGKTTLTIPVASNVTPAQNCAKKYNLLLTHDGIVPEKIFSLSSPRQNLVPESETIIETRNHPKINDHDDQSELNLSCSWSDKLRIKSKSQHASAIAQSMASQRRSAQNARGAQRDGPPGCPREIGSLL